MRIVTPSAALIGLSDISFPPSARTLVFWFLTNPRQLFAHEHVDDAASAKDSLHYDTAGAVIGRLTNPRSSFAKRMRLERCQRGVSIFRRHDADNLALVRKIKRIKTQNLAEAFDLAAKRRAVFINLNTHLRRLGDFVQDRGKSSAGGIPQEAGTRYG